MNPESLEKEIQALRAKVRGFRKRARSDDRSALSVEALAELSNALEELRVSNEELIRQQQMLKVAQLERERERRKYVDLFRSAPDGYLVTDVEGRVTEANEAAERVLNIPAKTLVGSSLRSRVIPADIPRLQGMMLSREPTEARSELRLRRRKAGPFLATITRTVIKEPDGAISGHRWSIHDLTTIRQHEDRLRESEGLLRSLVDGAKDFAILRLDPTGRVVSWNQGAERLFGYGPKEVLGRPFEGLRDPEDHSDPEKGLLALAERFGRSEVEGWRVHKDGTRIWMNCVDTPLQDARGRLAGFVRVLRDMSSRRRTEDDLAEKNRLYSLQADVGAALSLGGDLPFLLGRCAEAIRTNLGATLVRIWTLSESMEVLELQ